MCFCEVMQGMAGCMRVQIFFFGGGGRGGVQLHSLRRIVLVAGVEFFWGLGNKAGLFYLLGLRIPY